MTTPTKIQTQYVICFSKHSVHLEKSAKCEKKIKIHNFKNIVHSCIISSLYTAQVHMHNWAKFEGSKF